MESPSEHIEEFIAEYHERWRRCRDEFEREGVDHDRWRSELLEIAADLIAATGVIEKVARSFPDAEPVLDPASVEISDERIDGGTARVTAKSERGGGRAQHLHFDLKSLSDGWLIVKMLETLDPPGGSLLSSDDCEKHLAQSSTDAELRELPRGVEPNGETLFDDGAQLMREFHRFGHSEERLEDLVEEKTFELSVESLGELVTETGVLAVSDFTAPSESVSPLARRLPPGRYPVEVASAVEIVEPEHVMRSPFAGPAALRVLIRPQAAVQRWYCADDTASGGHYVGVDGGNVAIFDLASYAELSPVDREQIVSDLVDTRVQSRLFGLQNGRSDNPASAESAGECAYSKSGWGDGSYPCYWGVDAHGNIARLFVDFLVVADFLEETIGVEIDWTSELDGRPISNRTLEDAGLEVTLTQSDPESVKMQVVGEHEDWRIVDDRGHRFKPGELSVQPMDNHNNYRWSDNLETLGTIHLEFAFDAGYRN